LGVAAGVAVIRGLVPGLEAGIGTGSAPGAAARISLLQTLVLPAFAVLAQRRWRAANPALLALWVGLTGWWLLTAQHPAPHQLRLITPAGAISGLGRAVLVGLLLYSATVTIACWRGRGWRPWDPNTWIGVLLAANTASIAVPDRPARPGRCLAHPFLGSTRWTTSRPRSSQWSLVSRLLTGWWVRPLRLSPRAGG
jgi:hypothetical protein